VKDGKSPWAYGLASIMASLTQSNDDLRREALAEKEITPEQYEQMQKIQKMQLPEGQRGDEIGDADPPEKMEGRIKELLAHDAIRALVKLATEASAATQELVATALSQVRWDPGSLSL